VTCRRRTAAVPGMAAAWSGGIERGGRGRLVPILTSGWGGLLREIDGGRRSVTGAAWDGSGGSSGERDGSAWEVRGEAASDAGLFIGAGRRYLGRGRARGARACLFMAVRAARPARFTTGSRRDATAVLLDKTRRAAMQWRASRGSGRREVVGGLRQRRTGGRRWRACAALRMERVTAQATRSRPGRARAAWRREQLGGGDGMARRVRRQQLGAVRWHLVMQAGV
jgi:hypothetical protein